MAVIPNIGNWLARRSRLLRQSLATVFHLLSGMMASSNDETILWLQRQLRVRSQCRWLDLACAVDHWFARRFHGEAMLVSKFGRGHRRADKSVWYGGGFLLA